MLPIALVLGTLLLSSAGGLAPRAMSLRALTVAGGVPVAEPTALTWPVWFNESGLSPGVPWTVNLTATGGGTVSRTGPTSSIEFMVAGGYSGQYSVLAPPGYTASPAAGPIIVPAYGAAIGIPIFFSNGTPALEASISNTTALAQGNCAALTWNTTFLGNVQGGRPPYNYSWTFGDGNSSLGARQVGHTYAVWGTVNVTLRVTDADRGRVTAREALTPPIATCTSIVAVTPTWELWLPLGITVGVVAALVAVVVIRRRVGRRYP